MKIYKVRQDVENFQSIALCDEKLWGNDLFDFDCHPPVLDKWKTPAVYILNPKIPPGDFVYLSAGILTFRKTALDNFLDFFEMAGEILPLYNHDTNEELYLLNVLQCPNAIDHQHVEWRTSPISGERTTIERYAFRPDRIFESTLFKVPETSRADVLTYSGAKDAQDEFKSRYEQSGLTGLVFDELWEG